MSEPYTFDGYDTEGFVDEIFDSHNQPRAEAALLVQRINSLPAGELGRRQQAIERSLLRMGITFAVYGDD